jgi:hypothetical protein
MEILLRKAGRAAVFVNTWLWETPDLQRFYCGRSRKGQHRSGAGDAGHSPGYERKSCDRSRHALIRPLAIITSSLGQYHFAAGSAYLFSGQILDKCRCPP